MPAVRIKNLWPGFNFCYHWNLHCYWPVLFIIRNRMNGLVGLCINISGEGFLSSRCFCTNNSNVFLVNGKSPLWMLCISNFRAQYHFLLIRFLNFNEIIAFVIPSLTNVKICWTVITSYNSSSILPSSNNFMCLSIAWRWCLDVEYLLEFWEKSPVWYKLLLAILNLMARFVS